MSGAQLYRINTNSSQDVERLSDILRMHLPVSLPLLGTLHCGELDGSFLSVWTTFDILSARDTPDLFSVITFSPLSVDKYRLFCSAESGNGPVSPAEEAHVVAVIKTLYNALKTESPLVEGIEVGTAFLRVDGRANIFGIGNLHDRWTSCLEPFKSFCFRVKIYHRPPQDTSVSSLPWNVCPDDRFEVHELNESDISFVNERCPYKRSRSSILTRLPYSVCLKLKGGATPISWVLLYPDGSFGMLHVEPEYRKMGVAGLCGLALAKKLEQIFEPTDVGRMGRYPWSRWEFAGVVEGNEKGTCLMKSLEPFGWKEGWSVTFSYFMLEEGVKAVRVPWSEAAKSLQLF